jgi:hypothetical protein
MNDKNEMMIPEEVIMSKILNIRGLKVMIDSDLAEPYEVATRRLNEQVKRNMKRFPEDFMFQLTEIEKKEVVANCDHLKKLKYSPNLPYAFTEHGAVMLASILNSDQAIQMNIQVIRVFNRMRQLIATHSEIIKRLEQVEKNELEQDNKIMLIFEYLKQLEQAKQQQDEQERRRRIGFRQEGD